MIENLKDLEKALKLCRKLGVTEIKLGTIEFKLGELPPDQRLTSTDEIDNPYKDFPQTELSPEQLMFYSAGGLPKDDPVLKAVG